MATPERAALWGLLTPATNLQFELWLWRELRAMQQPPSPQAEQVGAAAPPSPPPPPPPPPPLSPTCGCAADCQSGASCSTNVQEALEAENAGAAAIACQHIMAQWVPLRPRFACMRVAARRRSLQGAAKGRPLRQVVPPEAAAETAVHASDLQLVQLVPAWRCEQCGSSGCRSGGRWGGHACRAL